MAAIVNIQVKFEGTTVEKSTLLTKNEQYDLSVTGQKAIISRMVEILKEKGKKGNWQTGLNATKKLNEQYADVIDKKIQPAHFDWFKTLVPTAEFGSDSITSIIVTDIDNWKNQLQ